ncbi:MAG: amino acid adenylation domain-containing protein [Blastocatellia bacterium]
MAMKNIEAFYPLSPMQEGMLVYTLSDPKSEAYFQQMHCSLRGSLDFAAFERAWQQVVDRHSILRTGFLWEDLKEPIQVVHKTVRMPVETLDWRPMGAGERQERLETLLKSDVEQGFNLTKPPLMRLYLIRTGVDSYTLIWSHHHILLDGWSASLVIKEVLSFYTAFCEGKRLQLQSGGPYKDFISWLRRQDLSRAEAYWREALKGFTAPTSLGIDCARTNPAEQAQGHDEQFLSLPSSVTEQLQSFARKHQLTFNTLVQGAWALLLSRYSGEEEITFGSTVSGRPAELAGVESMVGLFINTLPQRVRVAGEESLISWLKSLQSQQVEMRQYDYSPLTQIQKWSQSPPGRQLFESILVFENYPSGSSLKSQDSSLIVSDIQWLERNNLPVTVAVLPRKELLLRIIYDRCRFDSQAITRLLHHLENLLTAMPVDPQRRISGMPLLTEAERSRLLVEWNATQADYPRGLCIHELFQEQAARTPDAVAVTFEQEQLTYRELNERANQLAHYLKGLGAGPEVRVAIFLERSIEMIVGLLGILKSGGAYVPLNAAYPMERLAFVLEDSQSPILLTEERLLDELPSYGGQAVCMDSDGYLISQQSSENLAGDTSPANLAYVIYTSGSTGMPKGVLVAHEGLCNQSEAQRRAFNVAPQTRVLQFASLSFDASIFEIVMALAKGATLCLAKQDCLMPGPDLLKLIRDQAITNVTLPPPVLAALGEDRLPDLDTIIVAGEACSADLVSRWSAGRRFFNAYGPTEFTVWATVAECADGKRKPDIGKPIENTQVYLLDSKLRPVPIGVAGELHVGGVGLARGYMNRAELTAEKFIPNPFSAEPGARLYKTGDWARYLPDGSIDFIGRIDHQVKVRGYRIELEEIEAVLHDHAAIRDGVVLAKEDEQGNKRLVAYVVVYPEQAVTAAQLRDFLRQKLPDYMIPAAFIMLDELPLTPHGKVDRRALPEPDAARPKVGNLFVAPRNETEELLAGVWSQVLKIERVGIDDDFFALGGDSILSVEILSQAQQLGLTFSIQQLFQQPTVRQLASGLKAASPDLFTGVHTQPFSLVSSDDRQKLPGDVEDAYPLTMLQAGMLFHAIYSPETAIYHSINTYHLRARLDVDLLRETINEVAARHPALRTSFHLQSYSQQLQLVHRTASVSLGLDDLSHLPADEQERALAEWLDSERLRHFDLSRAPLLRFHVHRRTGETFQFTFTAHHSIIDGWSDGLLLTELFTRYLFVLDDQSPPQEPPATVSFRDYVALELKAIQSEENNRYWADRLSGGHAAILARRAVPHQAGDVAQFVRRRVTISPQVSNGLKKLAQSAGVPIKSVLVAAHLRVVSLLSGEEDVITGLVSNGRPETIDGEKIIGLFLTTLPFRHQLRGGTWADLAREAFEVEKEMLPHRLYPLAQIQKGRGGQALFETCLNFTHMHVYQSLSNFKDVEVLNADAVTETNFTLMANFNVDLSSSQLELNIDCNATELCEGQVAEIAGYYGRALEAMAAAPSALYQYDSLLSAGERERLLGGLNNDSGYSTPHDCVHRLFEDQADKTPGLPALVYEEEELTYEELNARANQVAHCLRSMGVRAETPVALYMNRSLDLIVGLLGVLKAGGAYVPLDPAYPQERLEYMLEDSKAPVLLTEARLLNRLSNRPALSLCMDVDRDAIARQSDSNPHSDVGGENLSYIIYTSGSTGKLKGVQIAHRSVVNFLTSMRQRPGLTDEDVLLAVTTLSFDIAALEILLPLCVGARTVLMSREAASDGIALSDSLRESGATVMQATPATWRLLLKSGWPGCDNLKILCGGEALSSKLASKLLETGGPLWNMYGPTETTIWSTAQLVTAESNPITIGQPVNNTSIYVLDKFLQPVPVGVPGEVYIGGDGLARGYLNLPETTAEKFIPDSFSDKPGARLYRTGDLARYLPDVAVEFLGRVDHQVRLRGYRIELGEIEALLERHEDVKEAVAAVREDSSGDKRLVVYIVEAHAGSTSLPKLQSYLRDKLPDHMVPSSYKVLEALPLTSNGKVDRRALPAPGNARPDLGREYAAPRNATELMLVRIWEQLLEVDKVGIHDNFFDLGGHSLLATQVISHVNEAFRVDLPLRNLFKKPTITGLVDELAQMWGGFEIVEEVAQLFTEIDRLPETQVKALLYEQGADASGL